jgi:hypothetical protein
VVGEEALGGLADLKLLPGGVPSRRWMRCSVSGIGGGAISSTCSASSSG